MRAFIAVELPQTVRRALTLLERELAVSRADVKWVEESNLHITMRFLGEITEDQRQAVEQLLRTVAHGVAPFPFTLVELGAFPSVASPRVVWIGVGQGKDVLRNLAEQLEDGLQQLGLPGEERGFAAHVTLGRVRSPKNRAELSSRLNTTAWIPPPPWRIERLTLFQSTLTSAGPLYAVLAHAPLGPLSSQPTA